jgi:ribosomal protein S12 methylthiotransferase
MQVHLTTLGCPKNQVDSELMLGMLAAAGIPIAARAEDADCLVVNTCAFIDRARQESVNTILDLAQLKERGRCRSLIVTGCLTQRYGREILTEMPEVDAILGTSELDRIVDLVRQAAGRHDWATSAPPGYLYDAGTPRLLAERVPYAYVKIAEGCDMGCTFCAIPQFRGNHRSRRLRDVVAEVEALARRGIQEAILVSQDTLAYGKDRPGNGDIGDLLRALSDTTMPWVRVMYLHPAHVNDRVIEQFARARIVPYVDMPIQHADDTVLRAMRRAVTARRMREIIHGFRAAIPGLTLRTTVLVGFPGETEAAVERLLDFVEEMRFDRLGVFTYSPEEGTAALDLPDAVPSEVAEERAATVEEVQERIAWEQAQRLDGSVQRVLVDGPSQDPAFGWEGRTAGQAPEIDGVVYLRRTAREAPEIDGVVDLRGTVGQAPEIDGVYLGADHPLRGDARAGRGGAAFRPGQFVDVRVAAVEGYELVGEPA